MSPFLEIIVRRKPGAFPLAEPGAWKLGEPIKVSRRTYERFLGQRNVVVEVVRELKDF